MKVLWIRLCTFNKVVVYAQAFAKSYGLFKVL